jgi:hypothetical protein
MSVSSLDSALCRVFNIFSLASTVAGNYPE